MIETDADVAILRLADSVVAGGYANIVLDRLARQASALVDADGSCLVVRDRRTPGTTVAVAGCGRYQEIVGDRFDESPVTGAPCADRPARAHDHDDPMDAEHRARVAVPICRDGEVWGSLTAGAPQDRRFADGDLELLSEVARLAATAVVHAEQRTRVLPSARRRIVSLIQAIDARDGYTASHSETVVALSVALGRRLGLREVDLLELELAALFHDVGKIAIPDAILNKPGPLDPDEQVVMRQHVQHGARTLARVPGLQAVATIVRCHHERWDGTGYPGGLAGGRIPIASRVVSVCDAYDAMTSDRPYRKALARARALEEVQACAGSQFDPAVVTVLAAVLRERDGRAVARRD